MEFLNETYQHDRTPIFVACGDGFRARVLLSYWLEVLHRPGFLLRFPDWTHDFLWALHRSADARFTFVLEQPRIDLTDDRAAKTIECLTKRAYPLHVLPSSGADAVASHVSYLLSAADAFYALAVRKGYDLPGELQFDEDAKDES